jgi:choline dehydrogenase-like flavoprotein
MSIPDIVAEGIASGWMHQDASLLDRDLDLETDVCVIGTGAGGGLAAEILTQAGLRVIMIEEGPLKSSKDFRMRESEAYPDLYMEQAARKTKDKAVNILQGRCVGGGTTVNWTSSFDTPPGTLDHWREVHDVKDAEFGFMKPYFDDVHDRFSIARWPVPPNRNNEALLVACEKLGWKPEVMNRNVKGCANLGYCGTGCPLNAKQSSLVTTVPGALQGGASLYTRLRANRLKIEGDQVTSLECQALNTRGVWPTGKKVVVRARRFVLAAGSIGSPALLMRSNAPDPTGLTGKRTFLHPVNITTAVMPEEVHPWQGAPQVVYTDHFLWPEERADGPMGFKLEVPPMHPLISSTVLDGYGPTYHRTVKNLPYLQAMLALQRDGFHEKSQGGQVQLRSDGTPVLDYPFTEYVWDAFRRSFNAMVEAQFAAGAKEVYAMHRRCTTPWKSWAEAKKGLEELVMAPLEVRVVSAHVMGGCAMSDNPSKGVVNGKGQHHQLSNVSVFDGSIFPTSIGTNPQVSIFGQTMKNARHLAESMVSA